jgi:hypothetical protein
MSEIQAVAPAFGVVVQILDNKVLLQASDSAGRNAPHFAALVAVQLQDGGLRLAGRPEPEHCTDRLKQEGLLLLREQPPCDADRQKRRVHRFVIDQSDWPDCDCVLLLLGYIQPRGVGGDARPRQRTWRPIDDASGDSAVSLAVRAVQQAIEADSLKELRTGLVRGRPAAAAAKFAEGDADQPVAVTFAHASCHFPSDILDHMPDEEHAVWGPADASLLRLGRILDSHEEAPTLLLLAGDQVYVDATAGLFDPKSKNDVFRAPYERRGQSRGVSATMQRLDLRVETMLDDHEIRDNWEPGDLESLLAEGREQYFRYQRTASHPNTNRRAWRLFRHRGVRFFLGDTRTEREHRTALDWHARQIMGDRQRRVLYDWLLSPENASVPKFLLTPAAFLPRQLNVARDPIAAIHSDAWDGYPRAQHELLQFAFDNDVRGLVFLSGDQHISSFTTATVTCEDSDRSCVLHSIHSSGLYAPYPFANGTPNDYPHHEIFAFPHCKNGPYSCEVTTRFTDKRDGFALVTVRPDGNAWQLKTTFWAYDGPKQDQPPPVILRM